MTQTPLPSRTQNSPQAPTRTRVLAVVALLVLAPFSAEYLLGSISIRELPALPYLIPLYGAGALLIRESTRRSGRGWPTILLLGLAFGVLQAGIVDASMFDPHYEGMKLIGAEVPWLHFSATFGLAFVVNHATLSIGAPIALVEAWVGTRARAEAGAGIGIGIGDGVEAGAGAVRRSGPWLPAWALPLVALSYLGGCLLIGWDTRTTEHFYPSTAQLAAAGATIVLLIAIAFGLPRQPEPALPETALPEHALPQTALPEPGTPAPHPFTVGLLSTIGSALFFVISPNYAGVVHGVLLIVITAALVSRWSRRPSWDGRHQVALVAGAWLVSGCGAFYVSSFIGQRDLLTQLGHVVFGLVALGLVIAVSGSD